MKKSISFLTVLVAILGTFWILHYVKEPRMGRASKNAHTTATQMEDFSAILIQYAVRTNRPPAPTLVAMVEKIQDLGYVYASRLNNHSPLLVEGKDAWGHPFVYEWDEEEMVLTVRSLGRNGRDESGEHDDMEIAVDWHNKQVLHF